MPDLTPAELAAQPGPAALLEALVTYGGEASPAELRLRSGLAASTTSKWLAALRDSGLVEGPKPRPRLTGEGWALAEGGTPATMGGSLQLAEAIARWPAEPQRAFLRLLIAAVVSRRHLGGPRPHHHPGFIAAGRTGTGKTQMAHFACQVFGVDAAAQIVELGSRTKGEVLGRHHQISEREWTFEASPLIGQPLVVFDEFDKADAALQRDALLCFQGDTRKVIESTAVDLAAVPMLACNTPQDRLPVPIEYRRRSVVLAMDTFAALLDELDLAISGLEAEGGPPRLDLDALRPPANRLPDEVLRQVRELLRRGLTEEGWSLCSLPGVELLALGYAAGAAADVDLAVLAAAAVRDYLTCAETADETRPGWRRDLADLRTGDHEAIAALEAGEDERARLDLVRHERAVAQERESLELIGARNELAERLRQARPDARKLLPEHRPAGQGLRAQLEHLRDDVLASRSESRLAELCTPADALLATVRELQGLDERKREVAAAAVEQERRQQELASERQKADKHSRKAHEAQQRRAAMANARHAREQAAIHKRTSRELLTAVRAQARTLEELWKRSTDRGESATEVLARTQAFDRPLLIFQLFEPDRPDPSDGLLSRIMSKVIAAQGDGTWSSPFNPSVRFPGTRASADGLTWGAPVQRVVGPPLAHLHAREAELEAAAGVTPRKGRLRTSAAR